MTCPKCGKSIGEHDAVCSNCGAALSANSDNGKNGKLFGRKKKKALLETSELTGMEKLKNKIGGKNGKLIMIGAASILLVVLIIVIIVMLTSSKGEKTAEKLSEYIGSTSSEAQKKLEISFKDRSAYAVINNAVEFSKVYEPSGNLKADGINYPDWAVFVTENEGKIESVRYTNFKIIEDNIHGERRKTVVNLERFEKGVSYGTISDEIDLDYYSVAYTKDGSEYVYKYWYVTENDDEQPVILKVRFDNNNKYVSYESSLVYPQNI